MAPGARRSRCLAQVESPRCRRPPTRFPIPILATCRLRHTPSRCVRRRRHSPLGGKNPRAMMATDPVQDVLDSRSRYPIHLIECCLVTDGCGALVVSRPHARKTSRRSVYVLGTAIREHSMISRHAHHHAPQAPAARVHRSEDRRQDIITRFYDAPPSRTRDVRARIARVVGRGESGRSSQRCHRARPGDFPLTQRAASRTRTPSCTACSPPGIRQSSSRLVRVPAADVPHRIAPAWAAFHAAGTLISPTTSAPDPRAARFSE